MAHADMRVREVLRVRGLFICGIRRTRLASPRTVSSFPVSSIKEGASRAALALATFGHSRRALPCSAIVQCYLP